ncbi:MAG: AgmX/PglI C-terminal domain-containing protein [Myxococcales bacterium]|nr:AgmX/PglI C-terminal domain-containing protein [Myxococcales bacterium]
MTALRKNPDPACPYCKGGITPDLLRAGGNCPHCMLEIPGEEAATDPGLEQKQKLAAVHIALERRRKDRSRTIGAVAAALLLGLGGVGYRQMQLGEEELIYELDDVYMAPRDGLIASQERPATLPGPVTPPPKKPGTRRDPHLPSLGDLPSLPSGARGADAPGVASVTYTPGGGRADATVGATGGDVGASTLGSVDIKVSRSNTIVLEDDEEIRAMAKEISGAYAPQIETCVAARLKADASFKGSWRVTFKIMPDGTVGKISTTPLDAQDEAVDACIRRQVGGWRFHKISHEVTVAKTWRFSGQEW